MSNNPLVQIRQFGQSIWQDFISRDLLADNGILTQLIERDGLTGVTSNPAIFEKAINGTDIYNESIARLAEANYSPTEILEVLTIEDVRRAADLLRSTWEESDGKHGFVSLEVSPHLARDAEGTVNEARRLWSKLDRPNVMIKVPATEEGLQAIRRLLSEGINVNVTLLFSLKRYEEVAHAFEQGLEDRSACGMPIDHVSSVASFFLSRIDTKIDAQLDEIIKAGGSQADLATQLKGQTAIASAKVAYQIYKRLTAEPRWQKLASKRAHPQRLLWASTSAKNPEYSDVKYVEPLIGPDTVNTLPPETLDAYRDHGQPANRLEDDAEISRQYLEQLETVNINLDDVTSQLVDEGIDKFVKPFDQLIEAIEKKTNEVAAK